MRPQFVKDRRVTAHQRRLATSRCMTVLMKEEMDVRREAVFGHAIAGGGRPPLFRWQKAKK